MLKYSTAERLRQIMDETGMKQIDIIRKSEPFFSIYKVKIGRNDISQYLSGKVEPRQNKLFILAKALNVSEAWLMGFDVPKERTEEQDEDIFSRRESLLPPSITEDVVTFPISTHEKKVVVAYREKPEMQDAVDRLLEIKKELTPVETPHSVDDTTYIAAYGAGVIDDEDYVDIP